MQSSAPTISAPAQDAQTPQALESALKGLIKLLSGIRFYPPRHPTLQDTVLEALQGFTPLLRGGRSLVFVVKRDHFVLGEAKVGAENPLLGKLAAHLLQRRVQRLLLLPGLSARELWTLVQLLSLDVATLQQRGGIPELLQKAAVATIWVNELDLSAVRERKEQIENETRLRRAGAKAEPEEGDFWAGMDNLPGSEAEAQVAAAQAGKSSEAAPEKQLEELLRQLRAAHGEASFRDLVLQLPPLVRLNLTGAGRFLAVQALLLLSRKVLDRAASDSRRDICQRALAQLATADILDFVIDLLCSKELPGDRRPDLQTIAGALGGGMAARLMHRLGQEKDSLRRKLLSETLIRQGRAALEVLVEHLTDERWYVVRNVVVILGEIRDGQVVSSLQKCLEHPDLRVRRETVRALTRIGGTAAVEVLLRILERGDADLQRQALLSLGALKNPLAVPALLKIAGQSDPMVKELENKKEAIKALGEIGSDQATPLLMALLGQRKFWFRSRYNEIRTAAALALGEIGSSLAVEVLEEATEDPAAGVARAAKQALKQIQ